ncbi:hypothetical protein OHN37_07515 [Streptomyces sp. NBC_00485]|uniref:hypothetical protein n=1 Tax=Streptomyces sp. NBC_00485 TaxID=2975758 RepID=UPI002E1829C5
MYAAVDFLEAEKLLEMERTVGPVSIRLTPWGINFAHSHMALRTSMTTQQPQSPNVTNNFGDSIVVHRTLSGSALATGDVNADTLASLVTQLRR